VADIVIRARFETYDCRHGCCQPSTLLTLDLVKLLFDSIVLFRHDIPLEIRDESQDDGKYRDNDVGEIGLGIMAQRRDVWNQTKNQANEGDDREYGADKRSYYYGASACSAALVFLMLGIHIVSRPDWYESPRIPHVVLCMLACSAALLIALKVFFGQ
jgi:hypothetical protein